MEGFKKLPIAAVVAAAALTACGGGGGGGGSAASVAPTSVSGTASKGIVVNGVVKVYEIKNGVVSTTPVGDGKTDGDGKYQIKLNDSYSGAPVHIEVTTDIESIGSENGTKIKCDLANGCGSIAYGDDYPAGATFKLKSQTKPSKGKSAEDNVVNVTTLTHAAAELAESRFVEGDDDDATAVYIELAKSQTADRFGVSVSGSGGDLAKVPVIDITDGNALNSADKETIDYAAKNAACVQATLDDLQAADPDASLEDALASFGDDYADNDGALTTKASDDNATDEEDIIAASQQVIAAAKTEAAEDEVTLANDDLTALETELEAEHTAASTSDVDVPTTGEASGTAAADNLEQVKAAVNQLRTLGTVLLGDELNPSEEVLFADQLNAIDLVTSEAAEATMQGLGQAIEDVMTTIELEEFPNATDEFGEPLTTLFTVTANGSGSYTVSGTADIEIEPERYDYDFNLNQMVFVPAVTKPVTVNNLSVTFAGTLTESDTQTGTLDMSPWDATWQAYSESWTPGSPNNQIVNNGVEDSVSITVQEAGSLSFSISGSIQAAAGEKTVSLTVADNSSASATLDSSWMEEFAESVDTLVDPTESVNGEIRYAATMTESWSDHITDIAVNMTLTLSDGAMSFEGGLALALNEFNSSESDSQSGSADVVYMQGGQLLEYSATESYESSSETSWKVGSLTLQGGFDDGLGGSFDAILVVNTDGKGIVHSSQSSEIYTSDPVAAEYSYESTDTDTSAETDSNYVDFSFSLNLTLDLPELDNDASVSVTGSRTGLEAGKVDATISYAGGNSLDIAASSSTGVLTIANQDGVLISISEEDVLDGDVVVDHYTKGQITKEGVKYASFSNESGVTLVRYSDGRGESLE